MACNRLTDTVRFMPRPDESTILVWPPNHAELVSAFRTWAGDQAGLRVLFTPDVLIGLDTSERRGYLYDDGWTVEVWIERGLEAFLGLVGLTRFAGQPDYAA